MGGVGEGDEFFAPEVAVAGGEVKELGGVDV